MAKIMLLWELGAGLGHLMRLAPIGAELARRGHVVTAAIRDVSRGSVILPWMEYVQAPCKDRPFRDGARRTITMAHLLEETGFGSEPELRSYVTAWRNLFQRYEPELVICDHSPTALLAARTLNIKRMVVGAGFECPPDRHPLPDLRPWLKTDPRQLWRDEERVRGRANTILGEFESKPLERLIDLWVAVEGKCLLTFAEMDHHGVREDTDYFGVWPVEIEGVPRWPGTGRKKIYAYLKSFEAMADLLTALKEGPWESLVYVDGVDMEVQRRFASQTLRFENQPVNLGQAAQEAALAITNANHATMARFLMAGRPPRPTLLPSASDLRAWAGEVWGAGR